MLMLKEKEKKQKNDGLLGEINHRMGGHQVVHLQVESFLNEAGHPLTLHHPTRRSQVHGQETLPGKG